MSQHLVGICGFLRVKHLFLGLIQNCEGFYMPVSSELSYLVSKNKKAQNKKTHTYSMLFAVHNYDFIPASDGWIRGTGSGVLSKK